MTQTLCLDAPNGLRLGGNGRRVPAMRRESGPPSKAQLVSSGKGSYLEITTCLKPSPDVIRSVRGKYAHLGLSLDEFMQEKRRDAERGY